MNSLFMINFKKHKEFKYFIPYLFSKVLQTYYLQEFTISQRAEEIK